VDDAVVFPARRTTTSFPPRRMPPSPRAVSKWPAAPAISSSVKSDGASAMIHDHKYPVEDPYRPRAPGRVRMFWYRYSSWAFPAILSVCLVLLTWPATARSSASSVSRENVLSANLAAAAEPPLKSDNLTDAVQWDNYTLVVNSQRMFLHSGEFHPFRLPVPDLWLDIFQKMVAAGVNTARSVLAPVLSLHASAS